MVISGSKMRAWMDELLAPLLGKVDLFAISGIRTDIEKTFHGLRKELKSALEDNTSLSNSKKIADEEACRLRREIAEMKRYLQSQEQRMSDLVTRITALDSAYSNTINQVFKQLSDYQLKQEDINVNQVEDSREDQPSSTDGSL
jgi:septation ring formation regulator EzrA